VVTVFRVARFGSWSTVLGRVSRARSQDVICSGQTGILSHAPRLAKALLDRGMVDPVLGSIFSERIFSAA
jgi:hypothetical protein